MQFVESYKKRLTNGLDELLSAVEDGWMDGGREGGGGGGGGGAVRSSRKDGGCQEQWTQGFISLN